MTRTVRDGATLPRRAVLAAATLLLAGPAAAHQSRERRSDRLIHGGRLTLQVLIEGQGPFLFAIDTAASASVVADDLASSLGLRRSGPITMHTLIGREVVEAVTAGRIRSGGLDRSGVRLAVASRGGLDGADGLIGADLLSGSRLILEFKGRNWARISRSRPPPIGFFDAPNTVNPLADGGRPGIGGPITLEGRSRGAPIRIIVDTGAQVSLINRPAMAGGRASPLLLDDGTDRIPVMSPTGSSAIASAVLLHDLHFAGVALRRMPVLAGDFHVFRHWGYGDVPAILMGVDILGLFETVIVDLGRGEIMLGA